MRVYISKHSKGGSQSLDFKFMLGLGQLKPTWATLAPVSEQ